jgi:response regulator NasT
MVISLGHQVVAVAATGKEAVEQARLHQPELILMDIRMPEMDGIEATQAIMARTPTPIITLTAYDDEDTFQRARQAGVAGYLPKPINENQLNHAIQTVYHRFSAGSWDQLPFRHD